MRCCRSGAPPWRSPCCRSASSGGGALLFVVLFLGIWAAGAWVAPREPGLWPAYWFPFLLLGILFGTVVALLVHHGRERPAQEVREIETALGVFFWSLVAALIWAIVWAYVR
jgi:hypothetical protein